MYTFRVDCFILQDKFAEKYKKYGKKQQKADNKTGKLLKVVKSGSQLV